MSLKVKREEVVSKVKIQFLATQILPIKILIFNLFINSSVFWYLKKTSASPMLNHLTNIH